VVCLTVTSAYPATAKPNTKKAATNVRVITILLRAGRGAC
jgi:hypothetical protein